VKCLEGENPQAIAKRAEGIVSAMEDGSDFNGRQLPKPDDSVYNSLFQVKAHAGMRSALENPKLKRNRHMFLTELSSMAHDPSSFDVEVGLQLISHMRTSSEKENDPSLEPDMEIFNAPLRWSGGPLWSRHYSRAIAWDRYSDIFQNGFKEEGDGDSLLHQQAEKLERWVELLQSHSFGQGQLEPTIETYESLIQAWVRTGSFEGVKRAEFHADKLVNGEYPGVRPRLQTFYPILAAWAYAGSTEAPLKIDTWLEHMREVIPEHDCRQRFLVVSTMSEVSLQERILDRLGDTPVNTSPEVIENLSTAASKCSDILEASVKRFKESSDFVLPREIFLLTLQAWYNVALADSSTEGKTNRLQYYFKQMNEIEKTFESFLTWLYQNDTEVSRPQFLHLLRHSPSIYGTQLAAMVDLDKRRGDSNLMNYLDFLEEKIQRCSEFQSFLGDAGCGLDETTIDYGDTQAFPSEILLRNSSCETWIDFIEQGVGVLKRTTENSSLHEADLIRLSIRIGRLLETIMLKDPTPDSKDSKALVEDLTQLLVDACRRTTGVTEAGRPGDPISLNVLQVWENTVSKIKDSNERTKEEVNNHGTKEGAYPHTNQRGSVKTQKRPKRKKNRGNSTSSSPRRPASRGLPSRSSRRPPPHRSQHVAN